MLNENYYPMSYEEFEKRVIELFLENYSDEMKNKIDEEVMEDKKLIGILYGQSCFIYDNLDFERH